MKKIFLNITALLFAGIFLFAGTGFNVYHYCCSLCEESEHLIHELSTCNKVHASHHCCDSTEPEQAGKQASSDPTAACEHQGNSSEGCYVERFDLTDNTVVAERISLPLHWSIDFLLTYVTISTFAVYPAESMLYAAHAPPILLSGRDILARHATYLI